MGAIVAAVRRADATRIAAGVADALLQRLSRLSQNEPKMPHKQVEGQQGGLDPFSHIYFPNPKECG
jgi:hypothetical protein